jgi:hypothetical protein
MLAKADLETLAETRLEDSILLLQAGRSFSAYYLAGYAVELALKACIAKSFQPNTIPDKAFVNEIYQHSLEKLLRIAGLLPAFTVDSGANPALAAAWGIASQWTETSRYLLWDAISAASLVNAIGDPGNGVFQWVKRHW